MLNEKELLSEGTRKTYTMTVTCATGVSSSITRSEVSISRVVEAFLQSYLQNGRIRVDIVENTHISKRI